MTEHNRFAPREPARRPDARLRARRPHGHAARGREAPGEAPQLRRHGVPRVPAGRGGRRRRARDDQGRPVRALPDGGDLRRAQLAGARRSASSRSAPARRSPRATCSGSRSAARARTPRCRTTASTRCPCACQMVQAFQNILTRNKHPLDTGVISVTKIHAGEAVNVVPDDCVVEGTVRTFTNEVLELIERRMKTIAEATCAAFEAQCEFEFRRQYPATVNHVAETDFARRVLGEVVGAQNVLDFRPTMGAEDFSLLPAGDSGLLFPDRQWRRRAPRGRSRPGTLHASQPELRLQRRPDPARRHRLGAHRRGLVGEPDRAAPLVDAPVGGSRRRPCSAASRAGSACSTRSSARATACRTRC